MDSPRGYHYFPRNVVVVVVVVVVVLIFTARHEALQSLGAGG